MVKQVWPTETVYVRRDDGHECVIAAADFDAKTMERIDEPTPAPAPAETAEDAPSSDGEETTAAEIDGEDYDGLNAGECIELIRDTEDTEHVRAIAVYEADNKARKTVMHAAAARIEELEGTEGGA